MARWVDVSDMARLAVTGDGSYAFGSEKASEEYPCTSTCSPFESVSGVHRIVSIRVIKDSGDGSCSNF